MKDSRFLDNEVKLKGIEGLTHAQLKESEFRKLSTFITGELGIKMPPAKKTMLQSRLHKRLRALNMNSFKDYLEYVFSDEGKRKELIHMFDVVTTNKTDFFREPSHFDFLEEVALPYFISKTKYRPLKVWSAGCSSGEEPYTLAMVLEEFLEKNPGFSYHIFGTDISYRILKSAVNAVFEERKAVGIPMSYKKKYFLRSKNPGQKKFRVVPELRKRVSFQRLNFMDHQYPVQETYDVIFCRNVLIYFDRKTQEEVIQKLCQHLAPDGFFFLGHSESIMNMDVPLEQIKPTVFRKNSGIINR